MNCLVYYNEWKILAILPLEEATKISHLWVPPDYVPQECGLVYMPLDDDEIAAYKEHEREKDYFEAKLLDKLTGNDR